MTSLLRDEVPVPIASAASATMTSWPASAASRAIASPTTPAPITITCMGSTLAGRIDVDAVARRDRSARDHLGIDTAIGVAAGTQQARRDRHVAHAGTGL